MTFTKINQNFLPTKFPLDRTCLQSVRLQLNLNASSCTSCSEARITVPFTGEEKEQWARSQDTMSAASAFHLRADPIYFFQLISRVYKKYTGSILASAAVGWKSSWTQRTTTCHSGPKCAGRLQPFTWAVRKKVLLKEALKEKQKKQDKQDHKLLEQPFLRQLKSKRTNIAAPTLF